MNYVVYASNGPSLEAEDEANFGALGFNNFEDGNNSKALGARVGVFVVPALEVGYSVEQSSNVTAEELGVDDADALIQSVDLNYVGNIAGGTVDCRFQWVFSDVDDVTFDPDGSGGFGPLSLDNKRDGGYAQIAYRPSVSDTSILGKLEGVLRYDAVNLPSGAPEGADESRVTIGVNFWSSASSVFKVAYQAADPEGSASTDGIMFQWALGF